MSIMTRPIATDQAIFDWDDPLRCRYEQGRNIQQSTSFSSEQGE